MTPVRSALGLVTACAALACAGAWAGDPAGAAPPEETGSTPRSEAAPQASRAWEENGMQVIELAPARRTSVYATRGPDGAIEITHAEPGQLDDHDD